MPTEQAEWGNQTHRNNIYYNGRTGALGDGYAIYVDNADDAVAFSSDYNILVAENYIGYWRANDTFTTWKTRSGGDINSWAVEFDGSVPPLLFSQSEYALDIAFTSPYAWLSKGKGIPISSVDIDFEGDVRSTTIAGGPTDIGSDQFIMSPINFPTPTASAPPALNTTTTYTFGGRTIGSITWGNSGTPPSQLVFAYHSGYEPIGSINGNYSLGYWTVRAILGTNIVCNVTFYYGNNVLYTIESENNAKIAKQVLYNDTYTFEATSVINTVENSVTITGVTIYGNHDNCFTLSDQLDPFANLYVMLQGCYIADSWTMSTTLNTSGLIPLEHPYNTAPWNYAGTETVSSIPENIVDWILVELRSGTSAGTKVASRAGFLKNDGTIVDLDGVSKLSFPDLPAGSYYVVVKHRNHLAIMSAAPVALSSSGTSYVFSSSQASAYGTNPLKDLGGGAFGMYSGDANGSSVIDVLDRGNTWNNRNQSGVYNNNDNDLSGVIDVLDRGTTWNNRNITSQVP